MKPKQNSDSLKKQISEIKVPKIQKYFKSAPKSFHINGKTTISDNNGNNVKAFYIEALKEKLRDVNAIVEQDDDQLENEEDGACALVPANHDVPTDNNSVKTTSECNECKQKVIEAQEWEKKYNEAKVYEEKYKALKKNYLKLTINFSETDSKFKDLLKTVRSTVRVDEEASSDPVFTVNELKVLQSMPNDQKKDSTFILTSLEYAYKSDPSVLKSKTLKGTPEWVEISEEGEQTYHVGKTPLTPAKVQRIKDLFIERVSTGDTSIASYGERIKDSNINKLFAAGIKNIAKKHK